MKPAGRPPKKIYDPGDYPITLFDVSGDDIIAIAKFKTPTLCYDYLNTNFQYRSTRQDQYFVWLRERSMDYSVDTFMELFLHGEFKKQIMVGEIPVLSP